MRSSDAPWVNAKNPRYGLPWIDITSPRYGVSGALGQGTNDRVSMQAAIDDAPAGSTILFPGPGTYGVSGGNGEQGLIISNKNNLTLLFAGGATLKSLGTASPNQQRIMTVDNCDDFRILSGNFDFNNIERYGGISIANSDRVWLLDNRLFDSNLNASWVTYDHYGFVVQTSKDVWIERNRAKDIGVVEADNCQRLYVTRNTSELAAITAAIGAFAVGDGYTFYDYHIEDNIILDPRKAGIALQQESTGKNNTIWKGMFVRRNQILHDTIAGNAAIDVIQQGGPTATGNVWEDIVVDDNTIRALVARTAPELRFYHNQADPVFVRCSVRGNMITPAGLTGEWTMDLRHARRFKIVGNVIEGVFNNGLSVTCDRSLVAHNQVDGASVAAYSFSNQGTANNLKQSNRTDGTWNDLTGTAF